MHLPAAGIAFETARTNKKTRRGRERERERKRERKVTKKKKSKEIKGIYDVKRFRWAARYRIYNRNERAPYSVTFASPKLLKNILNSNFFLGLALRGIF